MDTYIYHKLERKKNFPLFYNYSLENSKNSKKNKPITN